MQARAQSAKKLKEADECLKALAAAEQQESGAGHMSLGGGLSLSIEDFEIYDKLGKGSFGAVYLVKKKDDPKGTNYALKVLEKDKVLA